MKMNMDLYGSDGILIDLEFTDLEGKRKKFNSKLPKELQRIIDNLI